MLEQGFQTTRLAEIIETIVGRADYKYGVDARFYNLTRRVGFKVIRNDSFCHPTEKGIWSYLCQKFLSDYEAAPKTYGYFVHGGRVGFFTQKINVMAEAGDLTPDEVAAVGDFEDFLRGGKIENFHGYDLHHENMGYSTNWDNTIHPMVLDVGHCWLQVKGKHYNPFNMKDESHPFYLAAKEMRENVETAIASGLKTCGFTDVTLHYNSYAYSV